MVWRSSIEAAGRGLDAVRGGAIGGRPDATQNQGWRPPPRPRCALASLAIALANEGQPAPRPLLIPRVSSLPLRRGE